MPTGADKPVAVDEALHRTIVDMLAGSRVGGSKEASYEVLHYRTGMTNPRARIASHPAKSLNVVGAVARFVWMVAGSNRLEDIAYYESRVRGYTDDDLTVPGSSYGNRLRNPTPGLDQVKGVIDRLSRDPATRQAAAVVWVPEDAVRESKDIPCTFGMFFHIRDDRLIMCTIMRSNNAFRLLPYNFFEFSLLGEVIAASLDVEMGEYVHIAASMHVYDNAEMASTRRLADGEPAQSIEMPPVPFTIPGGAVFDYEHAAELPTAVGQVTELARLEARLRHAHDATSLEMVRQDAVDRLNEYWLALFNVLLAWGAAKRKQPNLVEAVIDSLPEYLREPTRTAVAKEIATWGSADTDAAERPASPDDQQELELDLGIDLPTISPVLAAAADTQQTLARAAAFEALVGFHNRGGSIEISQMPAVVDRLVQVDFALAARSDSPQGSTRDDRLSITDEDVLNAIAELE